MEFWKQCSVRNVHRYYDVLYTLYTVTWMTLIDSNYQCLWFLLKPYSVVLSRFWLSVSRFTMYPHWKTLHSCIFQVVGLVVGLSGVYLLMKYRQSSLFFSHTYITLPAVFALSSAAFLVATGCLGSWLSIKDSTFLQGLVRLCVDTCM